MAKIIVVLHCVQKRKPTNFWQ